MYGTKINLKRNWLALTMSKLMLQHRRMNTIKERNTRLNYNCINGLTPIFNLCFKTLKITVLQRATLKVLK